MYLYINICACRHRKLRKPAYVYLQNVSSNIMGSIFKTILILAIFQSCTTFEPLPTSNKEATEIIGIFSNDNDSVKPYEYPQCLWHTFDRRYDGNTYGLSVKLELTSGNRIRATLLQNDQALSCKTIKGQLVSKNCYYKRRRFYVVPILPILWWYNNEQARLNTIDEYLMVTSVYNQGGAFIIWAGGTKGSFKRYYKRQSD